MRGELVSAGVRERNVDLDDARAERLGQAPHQGPSGAVHERQGLLAASVQDYRAAIERLPLSQAAHIALSAVLQRSGRGDESRDVLGGVVSPSSASRQEPWWSYLVEPPSVNVGRLDLLRREARQ